MAISKRTSKRYTYLYSLYDKGRLVYEGISVDPERRAKEHKNSGKKFTRLVVKSSRMKRKNALKAEKRAIIKEDPNITKFIKISRFIVISMVRRKKIPIILSIIFLLITLTIYFFIPIFLNNLGFGWNINTIFKGYYTGDKFPNESINIAILDTPIANS